MFVFPWAADIGCIYMADSMGIVFYLASGTGIS